MEQKQPNYVYGSKETRPADADDPLGVMNIVRTYGHMKEEFCN